MPASLVVLSTYVQTADERKMEHLPSINNICFRGFAYRVFYIVWLSLVSRILLKFGMDV